MSTLRLAVFVGLASVVAVPAHAGAQVLSAVKPGLVLDAIVVRPISTNILTVNSQVSALLSAAVADWVRAEAASVYSRRLSADAALATVRNDVAQRFSAQKMGPGASEALTTAALTRVLTMTYEEAELLRAKLADQKESLRELSEQDMLMLQRMMEQKSQLESMISNMMKAISDVQNTLVSNLK